MRHGDAASGTAGDRVLLPSAHPLRFPAAAAEAVPSVPLHANGPHNRSPLFGTHPTDGSSTDTPTIARQTEPAGSPSRVAPTEATAKSARIPRPTPWPCLQITNSSWQVPLPGFDARPET